MKDVSIIIPCHNLSGLIHNCINSLISQTNKRNIDREIIFICDSCTDNTEEVIHSLMKGSSWQYVVLHSDAHCAGGARNVGLDYANSKYIWFIDGDDWLVENEAIDILYGCMADDDMDIVQFKVRSTANPQGVFGEGTVWHAMFSSRLIGDYRFNNKQNGEDNDFCHEMWDVRNPKFGKITLAPYFYNYPRLNSLSDKTYNCFKSREMVFAGCCTRNYYKYLHTWLSAIGRHNNYKNVYLFIEDDELNLPFHGIKYVNISKLPIDDKGANHNTGYTKASLARLYFSSVIEENKVIYLDIDALVVNDLSDLWDLNLEDNYIAGVIDEGAKHNLMTPNIPVDKNNYINSGVLVFNLQKIREDDREKDLIDYVNTTKLLYPDQDTLNVIFKDKIKFISNKYNSSIFTGVHDDFSIYHWAGDKENWVYDREYGHLWKDEENFLRENNN